MISRMYGTRSVRQGPGSAQFSRESTRFRSAHSLTVSRGGGDMSFLKSSRRRRRQLARACGFARIIGRRLRALVVRIQRRVFPDLAKRIEQLVGHLLEAELRLADGLDAHEL